MLLASREGDPSYVLLVLPFREWMSEADHREVRRKMLEACCMVMKLVFPEALDIVGIATEPGPAANERRSEDSLYLDARCSGYTPEMRHDFPSRQTTAGKFVRTAML